MLELEAWEEVGLRDRARVCLALGIAPATYDAMTAREREIWLEEYNDLNGK